MKGQITACGFVTSTGFSASIGSYMVKGQITACGFVTILDSEIDLSLDNT